MRRLIIVTLHILVKIINTNSYQEDAMGNIIAMAEYSAEFSHSESNEVTEKVISYEEVIIDSNEKVEVTSSKVLLTPEDATATPHTEKEGKVEQFSVEDFTDGKNFTRDLDESTSPTCKKRAASREDASTLINYPFAVSVQRKGAHYTSGALLNSLWILTSAKEYFNVRETIKLFRVRIGSVDCKKGGTLVPIKKIEIHPLHVYGKPNFDVALLRTAQPVHYTDYIRPISLSKIKKKVISAKFMTTYWPTLIINGKPVPSTANERTKHNSMRVSTQRLIPKEMCLNYLHNETLHESTLCLKPISAHHSVCMPDPGAPLVGDDGLWGITSSWTSQNCKNKPSPTMFTRISSPSVRSWLDTQMVEMIFYTL